MVTTGKATGLEKTLLSEDYNLRTKDVFKEVHVVLNRFEPLHERSSLTRSSVSLVVRIKS